MADFMFPSDSWRIWRYLDALRHAMPSACVLCKGRTRGGGLCTGCITDWDYDYKQVRWRCQRCKVAQIGGVARAVPQCQSCLDRPLALMQLAVAFDYMMPLDGLVWRFKERHQLRLAPVLARMMQQAIWREGWALPLDTVVAYIPSRQSALRQRGFNPAAELARYLARLLNLRLRYGVFALKDQGNSAQKHRTQQQRWQYAQQAFVWQSSQNPTTLLVVDDVFTTGSTLHGAACCALEHGVQQVYGVAAARVPWFI